MAPDFRECGLYVTAAATGTYHMLTGIYTGTWYKNYRAKDLCIQGREALALPWEKGKTIRQSSGAQWQPLLRFCPAHINILLHNTVSRGGPSLANYAPIMDKFLSESEIIIFLVQFTSLISSE